MTDDLSPAEKYLATTRGEPDKPPGYAAEEPEPAEASQETESDEPALSAVQATDFLLGRQPDEEELEWRADKEREQELADGRAVQRLAGDARRYSEMVEGLRETCPGIDSDEAARAIDPVLQLVEQEFGSAAASDPITARQIYLELGGAERFGPDPDAERWSERALGLNRKPSAFTR